ncbi:type II restriction endonuclease [Francisella philomiragia]|uniref:Type II restriction endonuclease n=1 Tax=Francisella philomiragia TaxID=28110 RepID=A0ABS1GER0_9GAMM|nr:type II restriction endonuclease [Francisella philomiragia]MBK2259607.1 type II restriction endonuclease [Francisella philomiragia]MBK2303286.1 type II restriction endonuclease [Francisella philomiragia]
MKNIKQLIKLDAKEKLLFGNFIKEKRKELIASPKETAKLATQNNQEYINNLLEQGNISQVITDLRNFCYEEFLIEEANFNAEVLKEIGLKFDTPKQILDSVSKDIYNSRNIDLNDFRLLISEKFGKYSGNISPYIYDLCLSNTQARRSRAGKTFEGIIYYLYERFNYSYDSQSKIGKKAFTDLGLGKVVDSILPSTKAFSEFRNKTIVGSMKTTLRERWQEVVEEITRSNLPNIYLLTVDIDISVSKATQMAEHNIVLVVSNKVKKTDKLKNMRNIIDFETYFMSEIPQVIDYWSKNA